MQYTIQLLQNIRKKQGGTQRAICGVNVQMTFRVRTLYKIDGEVGRKLGRGGVQQRLETDGIQVRVEGCDWQMSGVYNKG